MNKTRAKSISLLKVSKAVQVPKHPLKLRLLRVLEAIDGVHSPKNLRTISVVMDRRITGGEFDPGLYNISLNPVGSHPELSLLHEVGHYLEWRSISKDQVGPRNFASDPRFADWLNAVYNTAQVRRLLQLLEQQERSQTFNEIGYLLRPNELWTRSYSQYIACATNLPVLFQQIEAENKLVTGKMKYEPYWSREDFTSLQQAMDVIFAGLGWSK